MEQVLAWIGTQEHGIATRRMLLDADVSDDEIQHRVRIGSLIREYRGVYRVGHRAPNSESSYLAAVYACGEGALLSGRAAAYLYGLIKGRPPEPEVTAPTERDIEGIATHRSRNMDPRDATIFRGIPVLTVARVLVELAASAGGWELGRACHEAGVRYRTTPRDVEEVLERRPTSKGAGKLRRLMSGDARVALSKLERRFLRLLKENRLPLPRTNKPAGGRRVDCRWPGHRLTVELDSYTFHRSRHAWEQDRRRERDAYARGDQFRRYTWGDVFDRPQQMLRELRELLRQADRG